MSIFNKIKKMKRSSFVVLVLAIVGVGIFAVPKAMHAVSSNEFCASCHTMAPMAETFASSPHGGGGSKGIVANCVDCHLPVSNVVEELYVKGSSGMRHMWGEYVLGMESLDYQELHKKRTDFVYDSGCESCHQKLESRAVAANESSPIADQVHQLAFNKRDSDPGYQCASCHYDIAHPNLKRNMRLREEDKLRDHLAALGGI